jgi:DNA-binding response OmpR family regulator
VTGATVARGDDVEMIKQPARILVIEDESLVGMLIEQAIIEIGCEVAGVASQIDTALELIASSQFDAAVLDINLRGEMSFPAARALRAKGAPFAFATGYEATQIPSDLRDAPVLQKPFQTEQLEATLRRLVGDTRQGASGAPPAPSGHENGI